VASSLSSSRSATKSEADRRRLQMLTEYIRIIELNMPTVNVGTNGMEVTLMDANHCYGAAVILLEEDGMPPVVHTGDFKCALNSPVCTTDGMPGSSKVMNAAP